MPRILLIALCAALAGCRGDHRPSILISRVTVSEATLNDNRALSLTGEGLKRRLAAVFDATGRFRPLPAAEGVKKDAPSSYNARVEIAFTRESDAEVGDGGTMRRAEVGVTLTLMPAHTDLDQLRAETAAFRLFDPAAPETAHSAAFVTALDAALGEAAADLVLQVDAARKSDAQLIADLAADGGLRDSAVRQLAERRNPAAVPALIERLHDADRDVVLRAMGALEGIRDQRAVRPLIDLTERQDPSFVSQVIYVIGAIGGPDAEAFLFTLQSGSPDTQVRVAATEASQELQRRRGEPKHSAPRTERQ